MAYKPQNFENGNALSAEELNYIEQGIVELEQEVSKKQPVGNYIEEETDPTVPAWAKKPTKPTYTAAEVGARPNTWTPSASDVGADPEGTAEEKVSGHNTNTEAHNDIRLLIEGLNTRLNALADSDDVTLDQMSELVAYIKDNRELIEGVTTNKVNVSDIIDNLTTNVGNKPLSAAQGVVLKGLIDTLSNAKADKAITLAGYGITDGVTIDDFNNHTSDKVAHITAAERKAWNAKANKEDIPTKFSQLTDDVGYLEEEKFNGHKHVWTDITDRAFGEFPADKGIDTVISNDIIHGKYIKVSDAIPTLAEVQQGGTVTYYNIADGEITGGLVTANFPEGDYRVTESTNGIRINYDGVPLVLISYNGNPNFGAVTFPVVTEAGVYFDAGLYRCMHSLTINNYTGFEVIRTLPKKYLPKDIGAVKTVNNTAPDEAGNININIEANKAFTSVYSNILKWDGNTTGLPSIGNADFKVYDEAPTIAEASQGGSFKYEENGEIKTFTFTADDVSPWNDDIFAIYGSDFGEIIVVSKDGASSEDLIDLEKGVYISSYSSKYISEIMFNGYEFATQVLKGECLPKHEHSWRDIKDPLFGEVKSGNGDTVVSDKVVYGNYHKVSDAVPTLADINKGVQLTYHWVENGKVSRNSRTFDSTDQYYRVSESTAGIVITYDGTPLVVISLTGSSAIGGWTFEGVTEAGTYFRQDSYYCTYSLTINEYTGYPYMFEKIPERYLPKDIGTGGGGGVSSWNDLTDRPFGEVTVKGGTLTWTGNMEGAIDFSFMEAGMYLVKLSDTVPTLEELANGGSGVGLEGAEEFTHYAVDEGLLFGPESGLLIAINENWGNPDHAFNLPLIVPTEINFEGMIIIPKGVYTFYGNGVAQCTSFTLNNYTGFETVEIKPIDTKYLPKSHQFGEETVMGDTLTWDGDTSKVETIDPTGSGQLLLCLISDTVPTSSDFANGAKIVFGSGGGLELTADEILPLGNGVLAESNFNFVIVSNDNTTVTVPYMGMTLTVTFPKKGVYFGMAVGSGYTKSLTINGYTGFEMVKITPLDPKYLPNNLISVDITGIEIDASERIAWVEDIPYTPLYNHFLKGGVVEFVISVGTQHNIMRAMACIYIEDSSDGTSVGFRVIDPFMGAVVGIFFTTP